MKLDRKTMVRIFFLAACIILFYLSFNYMNLVFGFIGWLIEVLTPFIIAGVVIFILNVPLKVIERHLKKQKNGETRINVKLRYGSDLDVNAEGPDPLLQFCRDKGKIFFPVFFVHAAAPFPLAAVPLFKRRSDVNIYFSR